MNVMDAATHDTTATRTVMPSVAVRAADVHKYFGETRALRGMSLTAYAGEIHAIVGENGSGKSTFAKILSGIIPADRGAVEVCGLRARTPGQAGRAGVVPVLQEVLVAEGRSVADNVYLGFDGPWRSRLSRKDKERRAAELMTRLVGEEINPLAPIESLPLAQRQWATIARALVRKPKVLVLDESTAALDLESAQRLYLEAQRLRDEGVCVLVVTHRIAELVTFADRATVLRDGVDVGVLETGQITEEALLSLMSGDRITDAATPAAPRASDVMSAPTLLRADAVVAVPGAEPTDMSIRAGEIIGFAGLDGQGQSQFLHTLVGIQSPISGHVVASTEDLPRAVDGLDAAEQAGLAFVSGDRRKYGIFPNLDIFENFAMHHYRHHRRHGVIDRAALRRRFDQQAADLSIRLGDPRDLITSLSGGNQQKVLIGRALSSSPRVLALDDPARGVDVGTKRELYAHLRELAVTGSAVIYLSSEIDEFVGLCDRVAVFRGGRLFAWVEGDRMTNDDILAAMFGHLEAGFHVEEELGGVS